jgi:hypothetical protein
MKSKPANVAYTAEQINFASINRPVFINKTPFETQFQQLLMTMAIMEIIL